MDTNTASYQQDKQEWAIVIDRNQDEDESGTEGENTDD